MQLRPCLEFLLGFLILALLNLFGFSKGSTVQADFKTILKNSYIIDTIYERPSTSQFYTAQVLFERLLETRAYNSNDVDAWASLGLFLRKVNEGNMQFALISEFNATEGKGHGFYAINLSWSPSTGSQGVKFLQAPHRSSDLHTYEIIAELFTTGNYLAAAWSTTYRDNVDLCKETMSFFNAFTIAAAQSSFQPPHLIQLHGFAKSNHDNTEADIIHSSTRVPASTLPDFDRVYNCFKTNLGPGTSWGFNVFKYPDEIDFLGGTLNINADNFYHRTTTGLFYHTETSRELRDLLIANDGGLNLFQDCLLFK